MSIPRLPSSPSSSPKLATLVSCMQDIVVEDPRPTRAEVKGFLRKKIVLGNGERQEGWKILEKEVEQLDRA